MDLGAANCRIEALEGLLAKERREHADDQQTAHRTGCRQGLENTARCTGRFSEGSGCEISA
eukprot:576054-Pyramimonas_sp.AAC.1